MERGLLWLPLLMAFFGLAWAGWNEYQKIEAYKRWAGQFEKAKYDIYAVLGYKDGVVTWGKPTRQEPVEVQSFSLNDVEAIALWVSNQPVNLENPPKQGSPMLVFRLNDSTYNIPFTDITLAAKWGQYLQTQKELLFTKNVA